MTTTSAVPVAAVERVRAFNRFYTRVIGVLEAGLAGSSYSLTEARVLWELAHAPDGVREVAELRRELELDSGYLSRILGRLADAGLLTRGRSEADARRQTARLADAGWTEFAALDSSSAAAVERLLDPLPAQRRHDLVAALDTVESALGSDPRPLGYRLRAPEPGEYGWVVARNGALYAAEYGWDSTYEGLVAGLVARYVGEHDPEREAAWIAEVDGRPAGAVFCVRSPAGEPDTAALRLLLVEPWARGLGIGSALVDECVRFARRVGYRRMTLWTNDVLGAARRIYQRVGFELDREEAHHSFGHDLVGQYWSRDL